MTRGPCPDHLAVEVHALTLASVLRRVRPDSPHRQTISDVVGEAFLRWLARPDDKTAHAAGEHAPKLFGDCPVAYEDRWQRPSTITHRLPKPNTSISTLVWRIRCATCDAVSTRGSTARAMP